MWDRTNIARFLGHESTPKTGYVLPAVSTLSGRFVRLIELLTWRYVMKDFYEILRQKEIAIERVRKEIAALKFVVPLLAEDGEPRRTGDSPSSWRKDS